MSTLQCILVFCLHLQIRRAGAACGRTNAAFCLCFMQNSAGNLVIAVDAADLIASFIQHCFTFTVIFLIFQVHDLFIFFPCWQDLNISKYEAP